jgi:hypothetical protein
MDQAIDARNVVTAPEGRFRLARQRLIGIALHHSVSGDYLPQGASQAQERAHIRAIDRYHVEQGYGGFGYHLAAFASGRLYQLGDLDAARAHVAGCNHELLGIVAIGTFTTVLPGKPQMEALADGIRLLRASAGAHLPAKGHSAWALPGQGTACPGLLADTDWSAAAMPLCAAGAMVRHNGYAASMEGRLLADGARNGVFAAAHELGLPPEARSVRLEVALVSGSFVVRDGSYAGRVDERYGARLGIIDACMLADGSLLFDCSPGTRVERIGCLGYWT